MNKLIALIEVKKIIAIIFSITFSVLSFKGIVSAEQFIVVFSTVIGYYFGQSSARQAIQENKN